MVLPEDDANLRLANEFHVQINRLRQMQLLEGAGGWLKVLDLFERVHVREMERWPHRLMILLIDFDDDKDRLRVAKNGIPVHLRNRVFILGSLSDPEKLRIRLGAYETIGLGMAKDCRNGTTETWGDDLLQHNAGELGRLRERVVPILFPTT